MAVLLLGVLAASIAGVAPAHSATTYEMLYSLAPDRSLPLNLSGATVADSIYVFTAPDSNVSQVRFFIDDPTRSNAPYKVERVKPFDLAGTHGNGSALPFDTTTLPDGEHSITAEFTLSGGAVQVVTAPFRVSQAEPRLVADPPSISLVAGENGTPITEIATVSTSDGAAVTVTAAPDVSWLTVEPSSGTAPLPLHITADPAGLAVGTHTGSVIATASNYTNAVIAVTLTVSSTASYDVLFSLSPDRSNPDTLAGATVAEDIYAFTAPDTDVSRVRFFVDDPTRSGAPFNTEGLKPFDLAGTQESGTARAFDTTQWPDGDHTVTAELTLTSGIIRVVTVSFTINQAGARLVANPSSMSLAAVEGGVPVSANVTVSAADGAAVSATATPDVPWLTASPTSGTTPATLTVTADPAGLPIGTHTGSVDVVAEGYTPTTIMISLSVTTTASYDVVYSVSSSRTNPAGLSGATVHGNIYVFTTPDTNVQQVRFFVDDASRSGTPYRVERGSPYDLAGTNSDGTAVAFDTTGIADGDHTVTAEFTRTDGLVEVVNASFVVANDVPMLVFAPESLALTSDGTAVASGSATLTVQNTTDLSYTLTTDAAWISATPATGTTPATIIVTADPAGLSDGQYTAIVTANAEGLPPVTLAVSLTVATPQPGLVFSPTTLVLSSDGTALASGGARLTAENTADGAFTASADVAWLTVSPTTGVTPADLVIEANPVGLPEGQHTGTVTATSGTLTTTLPVALTIDSNQCSPVACEEILVDLPYQLDFSADAGGAADAAGIGTGFTYVDPPSNGAGYLPEKLAVNTTASTLTLTTTSGLASTTSNSLDNALAVGIDAPNQVSVIETTLLSPPTGTGNYEQGGLWFGNDEDNYSKLVVQSSSTGTIIEHLTEVNGSHVARTATSSLSLTGAAVALTLRADPVAKKVIGFYSVNGGTTHKLGEHSVPGEFFSFDAAGIDPRIGTRSFGGIFASHRNGLTPQAYIFDDFSVTGQSISSPDPGSSLSFDRISFPVPNPTSMVWGPDNRLYVTEIFGKIHALTLGPDKSVLADEVITTLGSRLTLGITVDPSSTADNVVLWVSHSSPSTDNGQVNSSTVTRLSGSGFTQREDVITGLPRAKANHALNSLHFGPDGRLYIAAGGNTGAGAPNTANTEFGDRPEQPLSAALLVADVNAADFEGSCATPLYEFGVPATCDVSTWATGLRNMYDFVWHTNGQVYATDNGLGVQGTYPPRPEPDCTGLADAGTNDPGPQPDSLHRVQQGKYYGHPNPYRNECVFFDGSEQGVAPPANFIPRMYNLGTNKSTNGTIEYTSDAFCGSLKGDLILANYSVGDDLTRAQLSADGQTVVAAESLVSGFTDPLPLAAGPDGTIYVGEMGAGKVTALIPKDLGCWDSRAAMPVQLLDVGGTAIDGKVYVVGGKSSAGYNTDAMYVYDPATDQWTTAAPLPRAVENPAVVGLNGLLYAFGGSTEPFAGAMPDASVFDPSSGTWSALPPMSTARAGAAAQIIDGRIYLAGGMGADGASLASVEIYDPATQAWSAGPDMATARDNPGSAVLDGDLYVFGGRTRTANGTTINGTLTTVESLDPATGVWTAKAPMPTGRRTMVVGNIGGKAQVMGGEIAPDGSAFSQNEEYDPVTDSWRTITPMASGRHGAAAGVVGGSVFVIGGGTTGGSSFSSINEVFRYGAS